MAFEVVGFVVLTQEKDSKGRQRREKQISQRFTCRSAADEFCALAKRGPFPDAFVREVMKHDNIN